MELGEAWTPFLSGGENFGKIIFGNLGDVLKRCNLHLTIHYIQYKLEE